MRFHNSLVISYANPDYEGATVTNSMTIVLIRIPPYILCPSKIVRRLGPGPIPGEVVTYRRLIPMSAKGEYVFSTVYRM